MKSLVLCLSLLAAVLAQAEPQWIWSSKAAKPEEKASFRKIIEVTAGKDAEANFFVPLPELTAREPAHRADNHAGH